MHPLTRLFLLVALFGSFILSGSVVAQGLTAEQAEELGLSASGSEPAAHTEAPVYSYFLGSSDVLVMPNSSTNSIVLLNPVTGDLIDAAWATIPGATTPIQAVVRFGGSGLYVSDQVADVVFSLNPDGTFAGVFAPAGGANTAILDNIRGMAYNPAGDRLLVAVSAGGNANTIAQFDNTGTYVGQFGPSINSPWNFLFRASDVLITQSSAPQGAHRFDLNGNYLDQFATVAFPQQMHRAITGNILIAGFSTPSGVHEFTSTGTAVATYNVITGNRGVFELPNGNILTSNAAGVHEITRANTLVRTILSAQGRHFTLIPAAAIPVEMTSFDATTRGRDVLLTWGTASETNNAGFEVQMRGPGQSDFQVVDFVTGHGTTTEARSYAYTVHGLAPGRHVFRLRQVDYDGASMVTAQVLAEVELAGSHELSAAYPNPFNPSTSFSLAVARTQNVAVEVYNMLGQKVATLHNGRLEASENHRFTFEASGLPSGTYLVKATGEHFAASTRVTLLK